MHGADYSQSCQRHSSFGRVRATPPARAPRISTSPCVSSSIPTPRCRTKSCAGFPCPSQHSPRLHAQQDGKPQEPGDRAGQICGSSRSGREFGQQTAEQAKQRADEVRRNEQKPKPPGPPHTPQDTADAPRAQNLHRRRRWPVWSRGTTPEAQNRFTEASAAFEARTSPVRWRCTNRRWRWAWTARRCYNIGVAAYRSGNLARAQRLSKKSPELPRWPLSSLQPGPRCPARRARAARNSSRDSRR